MAVDRAKKERDEKRKRRMKKEGFELVDERYKGKHGQSEKKYKDDQSPKAVKWFLVTLR